MGDDDNFQPIAILIDELKNDDVEVRLNSIRRLGTIATALGVERTRNELIPFLTEQIEDEDEVLLALAEELGNFMEHVGGPQHALSLLPPLEQLSTTEETVVREKAVESLVKIAKQMKAEDIADHFVKLIRSLTTGDWFTSRISACGLFATAYSALRNAGLTGAETTELRRLFQILCEDDTPMVRRAVSSNFGTFAQEVEKDFMKAELLPAFTKLSLDDQDSVRLLAVDNCVKLAQLLGDDDRSTFVVPTVRASAGDKSWRVRYCAAEKFSELATALGPGITRADLVALFVRLLKDSEAEVRGVAAKQVTGVAEAGVPVDLILSQILPCVEELAADASQHVRTSLAGVIMGLAPPVGREVTIEKLVPLYLQLLKDEFPDVRLAIIGKLDAVNDVIGIDLLSQSLLPAVVELARDRMWRVRLAIIEYIPLLAKQLGPQYFNEVTVNGENLSKLSMAWLSDEVHAIREAACINLKNLADVFGEDWAKQVLIPEIKRMQSSQNYLYRLTTLACIGLLAEILDPKLLSSELLQTLLALAEDPVPNVRFNAANALSQVCKHIDGPTIQSKVKPLLTNMCDDQDPDVQYFSYRALQELA